MSIALALNANFASAGFFAPHYFENPPTQNIPAAASAGTG
jgi:hypothetical protein